MTTDTKYFTPIEARRTLPLVKNIVKDILDTTKEIRLIADDLNGKIENNPKIGCYYKDWNFTIGLIDFPAIIDGKEVFLCWKSDEDDIIYYHDIEAGFAGRKLIPEKYYKA